MPVQVSYPGVYIQEVPSGSRAIAGVPTSVAAFVGFTSRGPTNEAVQLFSYADFERSFGGLHVDSPVSYAANHFFLNGGATCWIVRVAEGAVAASVMLGVGATPTLLATASAEGDWGNRLVLIVDYATSNPASTFNLTVNEMVERNGRDVVARTEVHRNLSMDPLSATYAVTVVSGDSDLIELEDQSAPVGNATAVSAEADTSLLGDAARRIAVSINGGPVQEHFLFDEGQAATMATLDLVAAEIQDFVANQLGFAGFTCTGPNAATGTLSCTLPPTARTGSIVFRNASFASAAAALGLGLVNGGRETEAAALARPGESGSLSGDLSAFTGAGIAAGDAMTVDLRDINNVVLDNATTVTFDTVPATVAEARTAIENAMRTSTVPAIAQASVAVVDNRLQIRAGGAGYANHFAFTDTTNTPSVALALDGAAIRDRVVDQRRTRGRREVERRRAREARVATVVQRAIAQGVHRGDRSQLVAAVVEVRDAVAVEQAARDGRLVVLRDVADAAAGVVREYAVRDPRIAGALDMEPVARVAVHDDVEIVAAGAEHVDDVSGSDVAGEDAVVDRRVAAAGHVQRGAAATGVAIRDERAVRDRRRRPLHECAAAAGRSGGAVLDRESVDDALVAEHQHAAGVLRVEDRPVLHRPTVDRLAAVAVAAEQRDARGDHERAGVGALGDPDLVTGAGDRERGLHGLERARPGRAVARDHDRRIDVVTCRGNGRRAERDRREHTCGEPTWESCRHLSSSSVTVASWFHVWILPDESSPMRPFATRIGGRRRPGRRRIGCFAVG